jgi:uncharacterized protein with FMN-binding domain
MQNKINPAVAALIVIVLIGAATAGVMKLDERSGDKTTLPSQTTSVPPSDNNTIASSESVYKDGTYSAQGAYITPGGKESIGLTVTLRSGIITSTELDQQASGGDTIIYQKKFASGYKAEVVGKNISEVELHRVAGSSLTSNGFNDAIKQIRFDASI